MDKRRAVLEKYLKWWEYHGRSKESTNACLTALDKLEKEKMLRIVGEDKDELGSMFGQDIAKVKGYNQAKAEIRKKINQPQDKERRV